MLNCLSGISATNAALNAERLRMDVIGQNIANAQNTHGADGKVYQRQQVVFETVLQSQGEHAVSNAAGVRVVRVEADTRPPHLVYNPGHPDADAQGMVAMPNINIHEEMADLMVASRAFEANLAVVRNARTLALQSLSIGKRV